MMDKCNGGLVLGMIPCRPIIKNAIDGLEIRKHNFDELYPDGFSLNDMLKLWRDDPTLSIGFEQLDGFECREYSHKCIVSSKFYKTVEFYVATY